MEVTKYIFFFKFLVLSNQGQGLVFAVQSIGSLPAS
jgi:hypothetical protein